jgi:hypothetical protein
LPAGSPSPARCARRRGGAQGRHAPLPLPDCGTPG